MHGMLLGEAWPLLGYHSPAQAGGQAAGWIMTAEYQNLEQRAISEGFLEEGYQLASPRLSSRVPEGRGLAGVGGQERCRVSAPPGGSGPARALDARRKQGKMWDWARMNSSLLGGPGKPWRGMELISNRVKLGLTKTPALGSGGIIKAGRSRGLGQARWPVRVGLELYPERGSHSRLIPSD